jgi:uncharacterized protein (TIGR03435 family)
MHRGLLRVACALAVISAGMTVHGRQVASAPRAPAFEDVFVTPHRSGSPSIQIDVPAPDRFAATNVSVRDLIRFAYDVQDARLVGGPDWIRSERFDVVARADRPLPAWTSAGTPMPLLLMVRTLLADHFLLAVHQETRELPVYELVVAREDRKFGPEIAASRLDCESPAKAGRERSGPPASGNPGQPTCGMRILPGQIVIGGASMSEFATMLSDVVQRVVIDRTRLAGTFDLRLSWTPDRPSPTDPPPSAALPLPPVDLNGPSLFAALQEQLGLKLEPTRSPLEVLVIDRAERPTAD